VQKGQAAEGSQSMQQSLNRLVEAGLIQESEVANLVPSGTNNSAAPPSPSDTEDAPIMKWL
jgi:hypothetical protein